jgi:tRNA(Arg) A34 adenosine deaminase TadA
MLDLLLFAAKIAVPEGNITLDNRNYWIGCCGLRKDGALVFSKNGAVYSTTVDDYQLIPESHAEGRVLRKMDWGGTMYVARVRRNDKSLGLSAPCTMCRVRIKSAGIKKVFYTINNYQYGMWDVKKDVHIAYTCKQKP